MAADDLAALLAHADWLRDLARKLVGSAGADDAVQDTYVAALRSPPDPDLPAKPWLARVLRNASRMAHRSATRRARREDAVSQIATPPSDAAETVARAETFRMLVELVLALDDPYRTTLLRHYFDGETFAAIARRDGIPEATVRGRHKHALEQLRRRLDARSQGDRRAWLAALAPLAAPPAHTASITVGVLIVKKLVIITVVAVLAAGAIWHWYPRTHASAARAPAGSPTMVASVSGPPAPAAPEAPALVPPQHVRKLASPEARRELAAQIAAAQTARKAARAPQRSSLGPPGSTADGSAGSGHEGDMDRDVIRDAMHEVLPFLASCYSEARAKTLAADHLEIRAHFTLTGDPDIGTVIDAKQIFDAGKHALPTNLDDCIRSTLQTLELPPLGDGDTVEVDYPLVFSDGPPGDGSGSATH
ncbi:MAG TPA: sigma-70 family RNA polymerase sigma factor [Kofleriaceae bacterium]|nr:sigma-70 family RNA polymerase sigma factor [Kofleriaceae bacterium]